MRACTRSCVISSPRVQDALLAAAPGTDVRLELLAHAALGNGLEGGLDLVLIGVATDRKRLAAVAAAEGPWLHRVRASC